MFISKSFMLTYLMMMVFLDNAAASECKFQLNGSMPKRPLILKYQPNMRAFLYPNRYNTIEIKEGTKMSISCANGPFRKLKYNSLVTRCSGGNKVEIGDKKFNFADLECQGFPKSVVQKTGERCHEDGSTLLHIGYNVDGKFLKTFNVCFDFIEEKSLYAWYDQPQVRLGRQVDVGRPRFVHDKLYSFNVDNAYNRATQKNSLGKILKSKVLARQYMKDKQYSLVRGHLVPKADFVFGSEQAATFHYVNVAPQWQIFNAGNWLKVESSVRNLLLTAGNENRYRIETGTHGVLTLPDNKNEMQKLYLHVDDSTKNNVINKLPVPLLFWKAVYDTKTKTGVIVVGINNPFLEEIPESYILCTDIYVTVLYGYRLIGNL